MAYENNADLPDAVKTALPANAQDIYRDAFNAAFADAEDDAKATDAAWGAVSAAGFVKGEDGTWKKGEADAAPEAPMPSEESVKENADKIAELLKHLDAATKVGADLAKEYGDGAANDPAQAPENDGGEPKAPPFGESFDPKDKAFLEALGKTMILHPEWARSFAAVAEQGNQLVEGEFLALTEKAVRADGSATVRIIQPGWGSSGYYDPRMLERDGPTVFTKGTQMFWNHPTMAEEQDRPEGSLHNLAGQLLEDARWKADGPDGPGLYSDVQVFPPFREVMDEIAPSIGVSIRAMGKAVPGEAEGRKGPIIEKLIGAKSVDFVTAPGAGGKVLSLFESVGHRDQEDPMDAKLVEERDAALAEAAKLREALMIREAKDVAGEILSKTGLPNVTQARLIESLSKAAAPAEDGTFDTEAFGKEVGEAAKSEISYLAEATGSGKVRGMGGSDGEKEADTEPALESAFVALGMSESAAKSAATGR